MISKEDILKLAQLARLEVSDEEVARLGKDMANILDYVSQVSQVAISSDSEVPLVRNVMREDTPAPTLGVREDLLEAFPTREGDYNVVRTIIQKDE